MNRKWIAAIVAGVVVVVAVVAVIAFTGGDDDDSDSVSASRSAQSGDECASSDSCAATASSDWQDDPELVAAVDQYRTYVDDQVDETITGTKVFTDAVRAGNVDTAKAAYAPSRAGWERIEPIAGLVEEIDGKVDARVDDFEGEDDPEFTGWHRLEYHLFSQNTTTGTNAFADQLDDDLQTLESEVADVEITPLAMARGASELVEEVSQGKITGEEDRYSGTDLWDFAANVQGSEKVIELLTPALEQADPDLVREILDSFAEVDATLSKYENADGGWQQFSALTAADTAALKASLADLSEELAEVPGALGLQ
jgi:iron uptake system component EfeO